MDTRKSARLRFDGPLRVNRLFVAGFLATRPSINSILDVGTGTAQILIELCRQVPLANLIAIDLADHMLALARVNVERAGLTRHIKIEKADAKRFAFPDVACAVISNSTSITSRAVYLLRRNAPNVRERRHAVCPRLAETG